MYLFIQHVGVLCEPHAQKLEGGDDHGVEVSGLEGSGATALVHDVATYGADGTFAVGRVHSHLHLVGAHIQNIEETSSLFDPHVNSFCVLR